VNAPRTSGGAARLEIVEATDEHAAEVAEFIRAVWNPSATAASVIASRSTAAARNVAEPGVPPPTWIARQAGRVLGYVTTIPVRFWDGERSWPAYWIKGLMVLPEYRNGPIGYAVMKAAVGRLPRSGGLAVASPARRLFVALGYTDLGAVRNWIRAIAPGRVLRRLDLAALGLQNLPRWAQGALKLAQATGAASALGWLGGVFLRAIAAAGRLRAAGLLAQELDEPPAAAELDVLWQVSRTGTASAVVRDGRYLRERYETGPSSPYRWIGVRRAGALVGVGVVRQPRPDGDPRLRGIQLATLVDLVYDSAEPATGLALLGAAERLARRIGADAVLATCSAPAVAGVLRRQCYLPIGGNVHFLFRDVAGDTTRLGPRLADWWLTRGDGQADEVF